MTNGEAVGPSTLGYASLYFDVVIVQVMGYVMWNPPEAISCHHRASPIICVCQMMRSVTEMRSPYPH